MEVIKLTSKELNDLPILNKDGYESTIYLYNDGTKVVALKIFKKQNHQIIENKLEKLTILNKLNFDELTNIQKLVMVDDIPSGYSMEYQKDFYNLLDLIGVNKQITKLFYLKQLREIVSNLHKYSIVIGDFNPQNFLIKKGKMKLCDIDNWQVQDHPQDIHNACQNNYLSYHLPIDSCLDAYLFNILTIAVLKNMYYIYVPNYIRNNKVFSNKDAEEITKKMIHLSHGYQEEYVIDKLIEKEKRLNLQSNKHLWI